MRAGEAHIVQGCDRQGRPPTDGAMEDEGSVFAENLFVIVAFGIDPEFGQTTGAMKAAWNRPAALAFPDIAEINESHIGIVQHCDCIRCIDLFYPGAGGLDQCGGGCLEFWQWGAPALVG